MNNIFLRRAGFEALYGDRGHQKRKVVRNTTSSRQGDKYVIAFHKGPDSQ